MSVIFIWLLFVVAIVSLVSEIVDPVSNLKLGSKGKNITDSVEAQSAAKTCGSCLFMLWAYPFMFVVTFLFEPYVALVAIKSGIGVIYVSYAMLALIGVYAIYWFYSLISGINRGLNAPGAEPDEDASEDEKIAYKAKKMLWDRDNNVTTGKIFTSLFWRIFASIPHIYLIYIAVLLLMK